MLIVVDVKFFFMRFFQVLLIKLVDILFRFFNLNGLIEQFVKFVEKVFVKDCLMCMFLIRDVVFCVVFIDGKFIFSIGIFGNIFLLFLRFLVLECKGLIVLDKLFVLIIVIVSKFKLVNGKDGYLQCFMFFLDFFGGYEYYFKLLCCQERLIDMIKGLFGWKFELQYVVFENDFLFVFNWVDNLKWEKEGGFLVLDKKVVNGVGGLVEKYGKCQEVVGCGVFGIVRIFYKKMENGVGEKLFVVKEFCRCLEEIEKKYSKCFMVEFCIFLFFCYFNVIYMLDLVKDLKGDYCEVMEFCVGGDFYIFVLVVGKFEVQEVDCFFKQMMCGVEYMYEMGVVYCDLKLENLFFIINGGFKIMDFGNGECFCMVWENDVYMVLGLCGLVFYIVLEEYIDREFDVCVVDVWVCGVIYMVMWIGCYFWCVVKKDEDEFYDWYFEGWRDEVGYGLIELLYRVSVIVNYWIFLICINLLYFYLGLLQECDLFYF